METLRFEIKEGFSVNLEQAASDAAIRGEDRPNAEVALDGSPEDCVVEWRESEMVVRSTVPLSLRIPAGSKVRVGEVTGDLILRRLNATVTVGRVRGDLAAREIGGDLHVGTVYGDADFRDVEGTLSVEECRGDLRGENLGSGIEATVRGDLLLETSLTPGKAYRCRVGGDIVARFPATADAHFVLEAHGDISAPLPVVEVQEPGRVVGRVGEGTAKVALTADGDISLTVRGGDEAAFPYPDLENIVERVREQVTEALSGIPFDELARAEFERAMNKVERKLEKARRKAERAKRKAERARRRAERSHQQVEQRIRQAHRRVNVRFANGWSTKSTPPPSRASEEEQLAVLQMLQENKISVEEADALLRALEER